MSLKIGWFISDEDPKSHELFANTYQAIQDLNLDVSISYLFYDQCQGEKKKKDPFLASLKNLGIDSICVSSEEFRKKMDSLQTGEGPLDDLQDKYYSQLMEKIPKDPIDIALLVGYTLPVSTEFINTYTTLRFRPALPNGPSGDRSTITWQLIGTRSLKSGSSMDFLTEYNPERGIPLTYCDYSIKSEIFFRQWLDLDTKMKSLSMKQIMETEGENNLLFKTIKETGEIWEQPLLNLTIQYLSTGEISIKDQEIYFNDEPQSEGVCLVEEIEEKFFGIKKDEESAEDGICEEKENIAPEEEDKEET